jgi:hypothetical protein
LDARKVSSIYLINFYQTCRKKLPFLKANQGNQQICRASGSANVCLNVKFQNSQYCFDVSVKVSFFYSKSFDFGCIGGEEKIKIFLFFRD